MAALWLGRLGVIWLLAYPVYSALALSPILNAAGRDLRVWSSGKELAVALVDSLRAPLRVLSAAFCILAAIGLLLALALSTAAWLALATTRRGFGLRFVISVTRRLPAYALLTAYAVALVAALGWLWLDVASYLGSALLPSLGERNTDFAQLAGLCLYLMIASMVFAVADVARGVLALEHSGVGTAILSALRIMRRNAVAVWVQATSRFAVVVLVELANAWLIARGNLLSTSTVRCFAAIATTELCAVAAISIRIGYIAWLLELLRTND